MLYSWTQSIAVYFFFSVEKLLTIENNNVKFPVAERLVFVRYAGPETARPPQGQS